jgi:hypothetical protein
MFVEINLVQIFFEPDPFSFLPLQGFSAFLQLVMVTTKDSYLSTLSFKVFSSKAHYAK